MTCAVIAAAALYTGWKVGVWWAEDCAARMLEALVLNGHLKRDVLRDPANGLRR